MDQVAQQPPINRLRLTRTHWELMYKEAEHHAPEEACGLLAGQGENVQAVIPVTTALHSPVRYRMDPNEQLKAFLEIERQGWELLGIYHTHPHGPEKPSQTDIAEAYYPELVYVILSGQAGDWLCQGFYIQGDQINDVVIEIEEG